VVGYAFTLGDSAYHAFLYTAWITTDLNTFLPGGSGWELEAATAINDAGQVVGYGLIGGQRHGFLIDTAETQAPEPSSVALFGGGAAALMLMRKRLQT
jgi:probable HAF family extracellular repeat protein